MDNIEYQIEDGTAFHKETPQAVRMILNDAIQSRKRLKFYFGDVKTGRDYCEEYDTIGTVGRSTGTYKIPLLLHKSNSMGGGAISDHCVVKIKEQETGKVLYEHPLYKAPAVMITGSDLPEYEYNTYVNGKLHGRHKTKRSAVICFNRLR